MTSQSQSFTHTAHTNSVEMIDVLRTELIVNSEYDDLSICAQYIFIAVRVFFDGILFSWNTPFGLTRIIFQSSYRS